jgi:hypothetical protein
MPVRGGKMSDWIRNQFVRYAMRWVEGEGNLCFWNCMALREDENRKDYSLVHRAKEIYFDFYNKPYDTTYSGLNLDELERVLEHFRINIFVYSPPFYSSTISFENNYETNLHVAYLSNGEKNTESAHFLYISNPEKLTNCKICPYCNSEWFNMRNNHWLKNFEKHIKGCMVRKEQKK